MLLFVMKSRLSIIELHARNKTSANTCSRIHGAISKKDECTLCIQSAVLVRYTVPLQYQSQISTSILYYKPKACSLSLAHS